MVLGFGPIGASPIGAGPQHLIQQIDRGRRLVTLTSTAILIPERRTDEGLLIKSVGKAWIDVARILGDDWSAAFEIDDRQWEEMLAGALKKEGFDVTLTPPRKDHGRDVIARKGGVGSMRMLGSMKAYAPGRVVGRDHVHEVLGVVEAERATKGMIVTTSDFAPQLLDAPRLAELIPDRLELVNGRQLQEWLGKLTSSST